MLEIPEVCDPYWRPIRQFPRGALPPIRHTVLQNLLYRQGGSSYGGDFQILDQWRIGYHYLQRLTQEVVACFSTASAPNTSKGLLKKDQLAAVNANILNIKWAITLAQPRTQIILKPNSSLIRPLNNFTIGSFVITSIFRSLEIYSIQPSIFSLLLLCQFFAASRVDIEHGNMARRFAMFLILRFQLTSPPLPF